MNKKEIQLAIECMREDGYSDKEIESELGITVAKKVRKPRSDTGKPKVLSDEHKEKMQEGRAAKNRSARTEKIQEILESAKSCHCGFTESMSDSELRSKAVISCTMPSFICPTADKMLRFVHQKFSTSEG